MSELPKGWVVSKIDALCRKPEQIKPEDTLQFKYIDISSVDRHKKEVVSPTDMLGSDAPSRARKLVNTGDVIVSMTRPNLNAVAKIPKHLEGNIASTGFDVLKPVLIEPDWLFSVVKSKSFIDSISGTTIGALYPACKASDIRGYEMPVPPLAEQKRIVEKLDEVLAQVDNIKARLDGIPAILKRFRQSVLASAVSGQLTEEWRAGHEKIDMFEVCNELSKVRQDKYSLACKSAKLQKLKKPRRPSNIDEKIEPHLDALKLIPCFPEEWGKNVLAFITDNYADSIVDGPFGASINVKTDYIEAGVPVIRMVNIRPFKFISENRKFILEEKFSDLERHRIDSGDVLLAKVGATTGDCCIYPKGQPVAMLSTTGSCRITVDKQIYKAEFLTIVLNSYRSVFNSITSQVAQPFLNMKTIKAIPIPIPQVGEQREIVRLVDQYFAFADTIDAQVKKAQARVDKLTQSILAKAFRGELVPQDPNDEPADKLLERISAARKEAEALAKAAKKAQSTKSTAKKKVAKSA